MSHTPGKQRSAAPIRVLLAEDQGMMRGALALLLGMEEDIEVVAQLGSGDGIVDAVLARDADVALLDIELPGKSGLDAAAELRTRAPGCRVLILTTFGRPGYLRRAMEAGAAGFLVKDGPVEELATAIRRVLAGETVVDPALAAAALSAGPNPLTPRECEVLKASVDGATVADIAARLRLSESTIRNYLSSAIGKTGTRNRTEAVREARQQGWLRGRERRPARFDGCYWITSAALTLSPSGARHRNHLSGDPAASTGRSTVLSSFLHVHLTCCAVPATRPTASR